MLYGAVKQSTKSWKYLRPQASHPIYIQEPSKSSNTIAGEDLSFSFLNFFPFCFVSYIYVRPL